MGKVKIEVRGWGINFAKIVNRTRYAHPKRAKTHRLSSSWVVIQAPNPLSQILDNLSGPELDMTPYKAKSVEPDLMILVALQWVSSTIINVENVWEKSQMMGTNVPGMRGRNGQECTHASQDKKCERNSAGGSWYTRRYMHKWVSQGLNDRTLCCDTIAIFVFDPLRRGAKNHIKHAHMASS